MLGLDYRVEPLKVFREETRLEVLVSDPLVSLSAAGTLGLDVFGKTGGLYKVLRDD